jgi:cytochrome c oxidase cbb3-type subunit III
MTAPENQKDRLMDHDADGIREFDNDLPRWWLYGFYCTIAFSVFYLVNWHVLSEPMIGKKGQLAEYAAEVDEWKNITANLPKKEVAMVLLTDAASLERGKEIYMGTDNACFTCHREDLGGQVGPNLTDDLWMHGCSITDIAKSIKAGFPEKGMLPYGSGAKLSDEDVLKVVSYIISRRGTNPPEPKPIEEGREVQCADASQQPAS